MGKTNDDPDKTLSINRAVLKKWVKNLQRVVSGTSGDNSLGRDDMFRTDGDEPEQQSDDVKGRSAAGSDTGAGLGEALTETEFEETAAALQKQIAAAGGDSKGGSPADSGEDGPAEGGGGTRPQETPNPPTPTSPIRAIKKEELKSSISRMRTLEKYKATIATLGGDLSSQSQSFIGTPTQESKDMLKELEKITETLKNLRT